MSPLTSVSASRSPDRFESLWNVRNGQKYASERKFFPAYVLAKMELTDGGLPPQRRRF